MAKGNCGTKSPASQLLERERKIVGIPKEMGKHREEKHDSSMEHGASEREYDRTRVR